MSTTDQQTTPTPEAEVAQDHTLDAANAAPGSLAFEYGYIPVVVWGVDPDSGKVEVGRFAGFDYVDPGNLSSKQGPKPEGTQPVVEVNQTDRIAALEATVAELTGLLGKQGSASKAASAPSADPAPAASPFGTSPSGQAASENPSQ